MNWELTLGIAGIVIGGFISYYFYRKSLPVREARWAIRSNVLIQDNLSNFTEISVRYKKQPISTLTVSKILFWNASYTTIERSNVAEANPLRIQVKDNARLLDVKVVDSNSSSSQFSVILSKDKKSAHITFDYIDKGQGAILQVVHTGKSSDDLEVVGDIKGGVKPKFILGESILDIIFQSIIPLLVFVVSVVVFAFVLVFVDFKWGLQLQKDNRIAAGFVVLLPLILAFISSVFIVPRIRGKLSGFPVGLGDIREHFAFERNKEK